MRRIVIIVAVVLSVPLAIKVVPAALAAARGSETTTTAVLPGTSSPAPEEPDPTGTPAQTPSATPTPPPALAAAPPRLRVKRAAPERPKVLSSGACQASFYGEGQATASGEAFNPGELTAAHRTLPFGSRVRVFNKNNDESVVVRINDRGPFSPGRCLDLSTAAMRAVGGVSSGVIPVRYEVLAA